MPSQLTPLVGPAIRLQAFAPRPMPRTIGQVQEIWKALKNIMFNAVAYGDRRWQIVPAATLDRLRLKALDEKLCRELTQRGGLDAYVAADELLQQHLLFSNFYRQAAGADTGAGSIEYLLGQQRQSLGEEAGLLTLFAEKLVLLEHLNCLEPSRTGAGRHDVAAWTLYYAWRKLDYLSTLETGYYLRSYAFDVKKLYRQLLNESDLWLAMRLQPDQPGGDGLELAFPDRLLAVTKSPGAPAAIMLGSRNGLPDLRWMMDEENEPEILTERQEKFDVDAKAEYRAAQVELKTIADNLRQAARDVNRQSSAGASEKFVADYGKLIQQRDAYTYLLERKKAEMSLVGRSVESAKSFVEGNLENHKAAALATLQALWAGAGVQTANALIDSFNGKKVDAGALGKRLAITAGIAAGTALATYLLGPLGPMLSQAALGYFFPQPDPLREGLKRIEDSVSKGFSDVKVRLQALDAKIEKGFADISANFAEWSNYIVDKQKFIALVSEFRASVAAANQLMDWIEATHRQQVHPVGLTPPPLPEGKLARAYDDLHFAIEGVARHLYHRSYSLLTNTLGPDQPGSEPTIVQLLIAFYKQPTAPHFRPFHLVCRELLAHCEQVQLLVERYFAARAQLQELLAVVGVFYTTSTDLRDKREVRELLLNLSETEDGERAVAFAGTFGLGRKVLGANNHAFYEQLMTYWHTPRQFNLLRGFGLLDASPADPAARLPTTRTPATDATCPEWTSPLAEHQLLSEAWFGSKARRGSPVRYYLAPPPTDFKQGAYQYHCYTMQDTDYPRHLVAHLALDTHDRVVLYDKAFGRVRAAYVVPMQHPLFDTSIERFWERQPVLTAESLAAGPLHLDLPRRPYSLRLGAGAVNQSKELRLHAEMHRDDPTGSSAVEKSFAGAKAVGLGGGANYNYFIHQLTPILTDTAVGLKLLLTNGQEQMLNLLTEPDGQIPDDLHLLGLWSTNMALGYPFATAHSSLGPDVRPPAGLLPFRYVLYAHEVLTGIYSANGRFQLRFALHDGYESVLYAFKRPGDSGEYACGKSVFSEYRYQNNGYQFEGRFQEDGNLVLYEGGPGSDKHTIAASNSNGHPFTFVHLTDTGRLLLRDLATGKQRKDIGGAYDVNLKRQELGEGVALNRLYAGCQLRLGQYLTSVNGKYTLKLDWVDHNRGGDNHNYGCALVLRTDGKELQRKDYVVRLPATLKHPEWDKCSNEQIDYLDNQVAESSAKIAWLDSESDGSLRGRVGTRKKWMAIASEYGIKTLPAVYTGSGHKTYLELTDLGAVVVRAVADGAVLAMVMEAR